MLSPQQFYKSTLREFMAAHRGKFPDVDKPESGALAKRMHDEKIEDKKRSDEFCEKIEAMQRARGDW